jgi:hypothetical protein
MDSICAEYDTYYRAEYVKKISLCVCRSGVRIVRAGNSFYTVCHHAIDYDCLHVMAPRRDDHAAVVHD